MQLLSLITVAGLALSQVQAIPNPVDYDEIIQKVVTLVTDPVKIDSIPEFQKLTEPLTKGSLAQQQLHQTANKVLISLRKAENEYWPLIAMSMYGYHNAGDARRAEIYRNSMFSRMSDLQSSLALNLRILEAAFQRAMGTKERLKEFSKAMATIQHKLSESKPWAKVHQMRHQLMAEYHQILQSQMPYLTMEQVNDALRATNLDSEKPAMLVELPTRSPAPAEPHAAHPGVAAAA